MRSQRIKEMARHPENFEQFMTPKQIAGLLAKSVKTIYKYIAEGRIPAFRIGGNVRIKEADFRQYVHLNCKAL